jgi:hypothetical protein
MPSRLAGRRIASAAGAAFAAASLGILRWRLMASAGRLLRVHRHRAASRCRHQQPESDLSQPANPRARRSDLDDSGTPFWLVGTILMERGMLCGIKARAKGFGGHIRGGTRPWKRQRPELPCQSGTRIQGWGTPSCDNAVRRRRWLDRPRGDHGSRGVGRAHR